jgi:uncharacterized membrane protein YoaK (UPF0700 family)
MRLEETLPVKKPWQSKTHWTAVILALIAFIPGVEAWAKENTQIFMAIVSAVFMLLRQITKGKIAFDEIHKSDLSGRP